MDAEAKSMREHRPDAASTVFTGSPNRVTLAAMTADSGNTNMTLGPFRPYAEDLAPGDRGVLGRTWPSFEIHAVRSADDPSFDEAWERLWREFGERGEMERREVIRERFDWTPAQRIDGHALLYEMMVVRSEGRMVAVRDHTVIVPPADAEETPANPGPHVVVHLSHVVVEPEMRGRGLAAWLRAMPISSARRCVAMLAGSDAGEMLAGADDGKLRQITLVAEMEHDDGVTSAVRRRLRSYARAGFRLVDPRRVAYAQPDFRSSNEITRTGEIEVPLCLVVRRVGREQENSLPARELLRIVGALHAMFGAHVDRGQMNRLRARMSAEAIGSEDISLLVPGLPPPEDRRILK
jgi:GNAT superfamily N-acetyltransferase